MYNKNGIEMAQIDTSSTGMRLVLFKERPKAYPPALQQAKLSEGLLNRRLAHISFKALRKTLKVTYGYEKPPPENNDVRITILCDCEKSRLVQTIRRNAPQVIDWLKSSSMWSQSVERRPIRHAGHRRCYTSTLCTHTQREG
jgi:hypothetical protein